MIGLIPAAGAGTRLAELTKDRPKEMLPVGGKPIIEHVLDQFREAGVKKIFIILGHKKETIMDHLGNGRRFGFEIAYLFQENKDGLGKAIYEGKEFITENFAVVLGDNLLFPKTLLRDVLAEHRETGSSLTLVGHDVDDPRRFGVIESDAQGNVTGLEEKPEKPKSKTAVVGMYVFTPEIFRAIEQTKPGAKGEYQITDAIKIMLSEGRQIRVVRHTGDWVDIGTKESYAEAVEKYKVGEGARGHEGAGAPGCGLRLVSNETKKQGGKKK